MTFDEKIALYKRESAAKIIRPATAWPLLCRLVRLLGIKVPPPPFWPAPWSALYHTLLCGVVWGSGVLLYTRLTGAALAPPLLGRQLLYGLAAYAVLVGGLKSFNYAAIKKRMSLPDWQHYPKSAGQGT